MDDTNAAKLRLQLTRHEGLRLAPYIDTRNRLTIGYGRNLSDVGISAAEAWFLLDNDIARAESRLSARYPWYDGLDPVRQAVLTNMAFNLGLSRLAGFTRMLSCVASGEWDGAAREMLASAWATQVGSRATELAQQMRSGVWA